MDPVQQDKYDEAVSDLILEDFSFQKKLKDLAFLPYKLILPFSSIPIGSEEESRQVPWATVILIALNTLLFAFFVYTASDRVLEKLFAQYGFAPTLWKSVPDLYRYISSIFLHVNFLHLLGNMLFLWVFGPHVERLIGRFWFVGIYIITGIAASLTFAAFNPSVSEWLIGASGAISGVMGMYFVLSPKNKLKFLASYTSFVRYSGPPIIEVSAWYYLIIWFGFQAFYAYFLAGSEVAFTAHVGGFIAGAIVTAPFASYLQQRQDISFAVRKPQ